MIDPWYLFQTGRRCDPASTRDNLRSIFCSWNPIRQSLSHLPAVTNVKVDRSVLCLNCLVLNCSYEFTALYSCLFWFVSVCHGVVEQSFSFFSKVCRYYRYLVSVLLLWGSTRQLAVDKVNGYVLLCWYMTCLLVRKYILALQVFICTMIHNRNHNQPDFFATQSCLYIFACLSFLLIQVLSSLFCYICLLAAEHSYTLMYSAVTGSSSRKNSTWTYGAFSVNLSVTRWTLTTIDLID